MINLETFKALPRPLIKYVALFLLPVATLNTEVSAEKFWTLSLLIGAMYGFRSFEKTQVAKNGNGGA